MDSIKLLDVLEENIEAISKNWIAEVKKNKRTLSYHDIPDDKLILQVVKFYSQLRNMLVSPNRNERVQEFFMHYARTCYESGIPVH
ncbi:MAG: RsbRD N-terminal domain-containing protein, partial [Syntrophaceae bacterium]|nr:RsbRD N-terminal domain-containing protein [Syntrophaceae bacterium]